jgi:hypothetical protein
VGWESGGSSSGTVGFWCPCMCLGLFLLYFRVLVSGIAGVWVSVKLV